jgi:hypothetical protein
MVYFTRKVPALIVKECNKPYIKDDSIVVPPRLEIIARAILNDIACEINSCKIKNIKGILKQINKVDKQHK